MNNTINNNLISEIYKNINIKSPNNSHLPNTASTYLLKNIPCRKYKNIIELGSGTGHVSIVLSKIFPNSQITGIEIQKELYDYSIKNKKSNNANNINFFNYDVSEVKKYFKTESFDLVISNPPHYIETNSSNIKDRKIARSSDNVLNIRNFISAASYLLQNKKIGCFTIHPSTIVDNICFFRNFSLEPQLITPAYGNKNNEAQLVNILFRKNGGKFLKVNSPFYLNNNKKNDSQ